MLLLVCIYLCVIFAWVHCGWNIYVELFLLTCDLQRRIYKVRMPEDVHLKPHWAPGAPNTNAA